MVVVIDCYCLSDTSCLVLSFVYVYVLVFLSLLVYTLQLPFWLLNEHVNKQRIESN
jgi:hypothetical protein